MNIMSALRWRPIIIPRPWSLWWGQYRPWRGYPRPLRHWFGGQAVFEYRYFCFGPPDYRKTSVPAQGVLHPKRIAKGVVAGVKDYGNKMGIPTVNGAVLFDRGYLANPLVYCGTAGIMPKDKSFKQVRSGDLIVVVGGRTGRTGSTGPPFHRVSLPRNPGRFQAGQCRSATPLPRRK